MEGGEIFQRKVRWFDLSQIDCFYILVAFVAEIDSIGLLTFGVKVVKRFLLVIITEGTHQPIDSPLIPTIGTEEESFANLFFQ